MRAQRFERPGFAQRHVRQRRPSKRSCGKKHLRLCCVSARREGRFGVTPERVALNLDDFRIPDNDGDQPVDTPIFEDGAPALFSNLPVKSMVQAIRIAGYPASLSDSAGTFVCNHVMYTILYHIAKEFPAMRGGFLHVPVCAVSGGGAPLYAVHVASRYHSSVGDSHSRCRCRV